MKYLILLLIVLTSNGCKIKFNENIELNGVWYEDLNGNANFTINNDRIYYFEYSGNFYLKIKKNYMYVYEDSIFISKYKLEKVTKDSLILKTEDDIILRYVKLE